MFLNDIARISVYIKLILPQKLTEEPNKYLQLTKKNGDIQSVIILVFLSCPL